MKTPRSAAGIRELFERLEAESRRARPIVERLVTTIEQQWDEEIPREWRNVGFVQELNKIFPSILQQNPDTAHALAQFALAVATTIPRDRYPSMIVTEVEGTAWRRIAQAHHYRSNYTDALKALERADKCFWTEVGLFEERAIAGFIRAMIYTDLRRYDEADVLLSASEEAFEDTGNVRLYGHCLLLRGTIAYRKHRLVTAAGVFRVAIDVLREADDLPQLATALRGLGVVQNDLRDPASAVSALHDALAIFSDLGFMPEIARTKGALGRVSLSLGRYAEARKLLTEARSVFLTLHMPEEGGLAGLELIEIFIALREEFRAVAVVEEVIAEFQRANLNERAATALAYLRDMVPSRRAREAARHVRKYVEALKQEPELVFRPLPEDATNVPD
jgi:tetratricopeptide (TPR) repeat protein